MQINFNQPTVSTRLGIEAAKELSPKPLEGSVYRRKELDPTANSRKCQPSPWLLHVVLV